MFLFFLKVEFDSLWSGASRFEISQRHVFYYVIVIYFYYRHHYYILLLFFVKADPWLTGPSVGNLRSCASDDEDSEADERQPPGHSCEIQRFPDIRRPRMTMAGGVDEQIDQISRSRLFSGTRKAAQ